MALVNRTVDEIAKLERQKKTAHGFFNHLRLAQRIWELKRAFFEELAAIRSFEPPPGSALS